MEHAMGQYLSKLLKQVVVLQQNRTCRAVSRLVLQCRGVVFWQGPLGHTFIVQESLLR